MEGSFHYIFEVSGGVVGRASRDGGYIGDPAFFELFGDSAVNGFVRGDDVTDDVGRGQELVEHNRHKQISLRRLNAAMYSIICHHGKFVKRIKAKTIDISKNTTYNKKATSEGA